MSKLIDRFEDAISGVIHGFDRIVFQGFIRPIVFPEGAMNFFDSKGILYKDAKPWMETQTERLVTRIDDMSIKATGLGIIPIKSLSTRKEALAHEQQEKLGISNGLIGAWSSTESASSFKIIPAEGRPKLRLVNTKCKHLYLYLDDPIYGFMNIRIQTWFPYKIQIALNGREWLSRQLDKAGVNYERQKNKFTHIDDYKKAQLFLDRQVSINWVDMLNKFSALGFPTMKTTLGSDYSYTWSCWQSEWASDMIFNNATVMKDLMTRSVLHTFMGGDAGSLMRFFGRPNNKNGEPHHAFKGNIQSTVKEFNSGFRVKHWIDHNSVKLYNEANVVRVETTINDPSQFKVHRHKQNQNKDEPKSLLPMRKGVADMTVRAQVSQEVNDRFSEHLNEMDSDVPLKDVVDPVMKSKTKNDRSVRGLDPFGKDREFLNAISNGKFIVSGFTNKDLRELLSSSKQFKGKDEKQISGFVTRVIRLMRDHKLIRKYPKQHKYQLSNDGRKLALLINAAMSASTQKLSDIAA